ncbi:thioesterase domain-containing protein, partial [Nocardia farcinica]|uniref:thioesterase domain-containing protein n=1 Tax=Nocardia farcinica TaxID=37329 RepID=UPI0024584AE9
LVSGGFTPYLRPDLAHAGRAGGGGGAAAAPPHDSGAADAMLVGYYTVLDGHTLDADELRETLAQRLPGYMVPAALVPLAALPRNANGKLDRAALPRPQLREREYRAPETALEQTVCAAFAELLHADRVGLDDNFFERGGNSLLATRLATRLGEALGERVPVLWLFSAPTPAGLIAQLERARAGRGRIDEDAAFEVLLPLRTGGGGEPLFCIHPAGGVAWSFAGLAAHIDADRDLYGLQSPVLNSADPLPDSIDEWARRYVREIRAVQPEGPYHLLGWSLGGVLAHAVAIQLQDEGQHVATLAMLDSPRVVEPVAASAVPLADLVGGLLGEPTAELEALIGADFDPADWDSARLAALIADLPEPFASFGPDRLARLLAEGTRSLDLLTRYRARRYKGNLLY